MRAGSRTIRDMRASAGRQRRVLIIVENLPCPFDRRVWQEACALRDAGYVVSIICPKGKGYESSRETLDDILILRHSLPIEADSAIGYLLEYSAALFWQFLLSLRVLLGRGFDVIHACNPPDTIFLVGGFYRLFGKRFLFDQHDINPELFEAKFGRRGALYWLIRALERMTYATAQVVIATNGSYRQIAIARGRLHADDVFVVRSGPDLTRLRPIEPDDSLRRGRRYLVAYVGVMGKQEGIDLLLRSVAHIVHGRGRQDVQFCLVGGGTEVDAMRTYARALKVGDFVTFTGRVPDETLVRVLSTADLCVNPDPVNPMNDKSTMNKIMEYMAFAKPIVQYEMTEGRVSAGGASLYANPNDEEDFAAKILTLLDDAERRVQMGAEGAARVRAELEWRHQVPHLLNAYERLFSR